MTAMEQLVEAAKHRLADCRKNGACAEAALMPVEYCSNECAALAEAVEKCEGWLPMEAPRRKLNAGNQKSLYYLNELQAQLGSFCSPGFFGLRRRSAREISEFCDALANAKNMLWQGAYSQFPEVRFGNWSINGDGELKNLDQHDTKY